MTAEFTPHPGVHRPWMFICTMDDPDAAVVSYDENPAAHIASQLLEEVGDWSHALKNLKRSDVPPAVTAALDALHDAMCGWTDWTAAAEKRKGGKS